MLEDAKLHDVLQALKFDCAKVMGGSLVAPGSRDFPMKQALISLAAFLALALIAVGAQVAPAKAQPWRWDRLVKAWGGSEDEEG